MSIFRCVVAAQALMILAGCQAREPGFGGSGGSSGAGGFGGSGGSQGGNVAVARDACARALRDQGRILVSVDSAREYQVSGRTQGVEVRMTTRRDAQTASTEPRVCRYRYASSAADISGT